MRILVFGDSIVHGQGDHDALGWVGRLQRAEIAAGRAGSLYNLGVGADTTEGLRRRIASEIEVRKAPGVPTAVLVSLGVNDATRRDGAPPRVPLARSAENLGAIFEAAAPHGPVLFVSAFPVDPERMPVRNSAGQWQMRHNEEIAAYVAAHLAVCEGAGVPALDLFRRFSAIASWPRELADGIHPDAEGHRRIADAVAGWDAWGQLVGAR